MIRGVVIWRDGSKHTATRPSSFTFLHFQQTSLVILRDKCNIPLLSSSASYCATRGYESAPRSEHTSCCSSTRSDTKLCEPGISWLGDNSHRHDMSYLHVSLLLAANLLESVRYPLTRLG